MYARRVIALVSALGLACVGPVAAADEFEALLLDTFKTQNQVDARKLRDEVVAAVAKANDLKETDPDRGIELLRAASNSMDRVKLLSGAERKAMSELLRPAILELRDLSIRKRRDLASIRLDAFKEYLQFSAYEGRYPGRSGADHAEPAYFMAPDGSSRVGKLLSLGTGVITFKFDLKERNQFPLTFPVIQVFGGFYVYDQSFGYQTFLTNREFFDHVLMPLVKEYDRSDAPGKTKRTPAEAARAPDLRRLKSGIDSGEFFLRTLPDTEPIPGVSSNEDPFLEFVAQKLIHKGLPVPVDRIYSHELQDRLEGLSRIQLSAVRRTLHLLQLKGTAVSPLYAEILREEVTQLLKSEYANFTQNEINRSVLYIFSKLK
jgi:hypothetical protein